MADLAISIINQIVTLGPAPSTKWGSGNMTWGASKWGEGTNTTLVAFEKSHSEGFSVAQSLSTVTNFNLTLSESIIAAWEMSGETVQDPAGYFRVFARPTTDAETQVISTYTEQTAGNQAYTSFTATSTTWS